MLPVAATMANTAAGRKPPNQLLPMWFTLRHRRRSCALPELQARRQALDHVDEPGRGLKNRKALRKFRAPKSLVEKLHRPLVTGVRLRIGAKLPETRDQRFTAAFDLVIALTKIAARRWFATMSRRVLMSHSH